MINSHIVDYSISYKMGLKYIKEHNIFPIAQYELFVLIAKTKKNRDELPLRSFFNMPIKFIDISENSLNWQIKHFDTLNKIFNLGQNALNNSNHNEAHNSYIINMLDEIILFAISLNASDIHLETLKKSVVIRFRIDGLLNLIFTFEYEMYNLFASIVKLFASLDISQVRLPQSGRFSKNFEDHIYDFRVSTLPTLNGESIVMRILDSHNSNITLKDVGFDEDIFNNLDKAIHLHQGLILVTGPTGSGKTTTLYSILNTLNTVSKKIITVEDPIEYNLAAIQQVNINEDINLDYSLALKNILRQDPDIIMIGEIRDEEALKIAIQAALTGHLVLATLHTNNALDTITRLLDLNAKPFLIASTLKTVISQRLVRKLCQKCKSLDGCNNCNFSGYENRIIVAELLECDNQIAEYISDKKSVQIMMKYAKTQGYMTLEDRGMQKVKNKLTSMDEFYSKIKM